MQFCGCLGTPDPANCTGGPDKRPCKYPGDDKPYYCRMCTDTPFTWCTLPKQQQKNMSHCVNGYVQNPSSCSGKPPNFPNFPNWTGPRPEFPKMSPPYNFWCKKSVGQTSCPDTPCIPDPTMCHIALNKKYPRTYCSILKNKHK